MIIEQVIAASIIMTTPILLAAIGGLVNRQAGIQSGYKAIRREGRTSWRSTHFQDIAYDRRGFDLFTQQVVPALSR